MNINHETKIKVSIITDLCLSSLDQEIFSREKIRVGEIISFIEQVEKFKDAKTSFYENYFTATFNKSIICLKIVDPFVSWSDIITYKNIYNYYERM